MLRVGEQDGEWILETPVWYRTASGADLVVPSGFVTDLASIPRLLHAVMPVNGAHRAAAILHDWLYETQQFTRAQSDCLFLAAMADSGVGLAQRYAMYAGVRVGGWLPWSRRAGGASAAAIGE
ncbi:DUF1353 domain-containing protein [Aromatoleum toluolicum]|uniref:DUF1353 domain-containing protein n=1 Tax=Aromatoleum toluolicum TaxID=90060 RepID=A0ABX1NGE0_9RHOO|nr:DUF1353 domain-containing protein [Aromatoleum toluolicum]NMF98373.1 DUF1353 domain-containing protein [Aromatoleum toluolicum]